MTNPKTLQDARAIRHQTQFADPARTEDNGNGHPFGRYLNISITFGNLTIPQPFPLSFWYLEDATIRKKIHSTFTTLFVSLWIGFRRYQNPSFDRPEPPRVVGVWQRLRRIERFRHPITAPIARLQRKIRPRHTRPREEWQRTLPNPNLEG